MCVLSFSERLFFWTYQFLTLIILLTIALAWFSNFDVYMLEPAMTGAGQVHRVELFIFWEMLSLSLLWPESDWGALAVGVFFVMVLFRATSFIDNFRLKLSLTLLILMIYFLVIVVLFWAASFHSHFGLTLWFALLFVRHRPSTRFWGWSDTAAFDIAIPKYLGVNYFFFINVYWRGKCMVLFINKTWLLAISCHFVYTNNMPTEILSDVLIEQKPYR